MYGAWIMMSLSGTNPSTATLVHRLTRRKIERVRKSENRCTAHSISMGSRSSRSRLTEEEKLGND